MTDQNYKKALRLIHKAAHHGDKWLDLSGLGLRELPAELFELTTLIILDLRGNHLSCLPPEIGQLVTLDYLSLRDNQLSNLPPEIAQLTKLTSLFLGDNRLSNLPPEIAQLTALTYLDLRDNRLILVPPEITQLTKLTFLDLRGNQLTSVFPQIDQLIQLKVLGLGDNPLETLPVELGYLPKLEVLAVDSSSLRFPPPEIAEGGGQAILEYLRECREGVEQRWMSKLLIVGEGGVGKTHLLNNLRGQSGPYKDDPTHGIEIGDLHLSHPTQAVTMTLKAWDFGGQEIYHATHQFFLSNRSLFLLLWNGRLGYEQGKLDRYWLDMIQARAPHAPVLIVATHLDQHNADLPFLDIQKRYPQVIGHFKVSNTTGEGIAALREQIRQSAAGLPLMGERYPATWLKAIDQIRHLRDRYRTCQKLIWLIRKTGVSKHGAKILLRWLHDLGELLYYPDDPELRDLVILKPEWVSKYISKVILSSEVTQTNGIFTREHMDQLWGDLRPEMREHFLRLMEKFDLSYRIPDDPMHRSLVVERLSHSEDHYQTKWEAYQGRAEIRLRYQFGSSLLPGIPTWSIARSHRFSTGIHWRYGALYEDREKQHAALMLTSSNGRTAEIIARGIAPQHFFSLIRDAFEDTLRRFPGIKVERLIACPGHHGEACPGEFKLEELLRRLEKGRTTVDCPETLEELIIAQVLYGIHHESSTVQVLNELFKLQEQIQEHHQTQTQLQQALLIAQQQHLALTQRFFAYQFNRDQRIDELQTPYVFTLSPQAGSHFDPRNWVSSRFTLQLCCQAPGEWHAVTGGRYEEIRFVDKDRLNLMEHAKQLLKVFKMIGPMAALREAAGDLASDIEMMEMILSTLEGIKLDGDAWIAEKYQMTSASGATLRALRVLLEKHDPARHWGGLQRVITPEGDVLWLCAHHAKEYQPPPFPSS
ncbi:MAG: GTPase [Anaerolineae bacterium]|jgi:GTPase SAR1 family protein|nr:GTPase [Anaerolineae bacterium]